MTGGGCSRGWVSGIVLCAGRVVDKKFGGGSKTFLEIVTCPLRSLFVRQPFLLFGLGPSFPFRRSVGSGCGSFVGVAVFCAPACCCGGAFTFSWWVSASGLLSISSLVHAFGLDYRACCI